MLDYAGPLQRLVFSRTLWLIVCLPIGGALWQALFARRHIARARDAASRRRELRSARNAGLAGLALCAVSTLAHAIVLARTPERALFEHIASGARVGCLVAEIDLWFDPLAATFCSLASLVALATAVVVVLGTDPGALGGEGAPRTSEPPPVLPTLRRHAADRGWRTWAWLQLSLAGALLAFVADGFIGCAMGWTLAAGSSTWLAGWGKAAAKRQARDTAGDMFVPAMRSAFGLCAMLVGAALLFWGLGGAWDGEEYVPELQPRFVPVRMGVDPGLGSGSYAQDAPLGGFLTLTSVPGALVFLDDARTPVERSPFTAVPVSPGAHTIRIRLVDAPSDEVLGRASFGGGEEIALVPFGPTLAFRAIADQIAVRGPGGDPIARRDIEARAGPGGAAVVAASMLAFLLAAWATSGAALPAAAPRALSALAATATTAMLGPYLLARLSFLFPLTPHTWAAVESIGAVTLLVGAWQAPASSGVRRWLAFLGAAPASLTWLSLGAAGVTVATYVAIVSAPSVAAFYLSAALSPHGSAIEPVARETTGDLLFVRVPERLGALFAGMQRWVVGAIADAVGVLVRAVAWSAATFDEHVAVAPADAVATRLLRVQRGAQPLIGVPLGRLAWALLGLAALGATAAHLSGR